MPNYQDPIQSMQLNPITNVVKSPVELDYKMTGPIAGWYAQEMMDDRRNQQDRSFRDQDINANQAQNIYQNEVLNNPVRETQRSAEMARNKVITDAGESGDLKKSFLADIEKKIAETMRMNSETENQKMLLKGSVYEEANKMFGPGSLDSPSTAAEYEAYRKDAEKKGVKLPEWSFSTRRQLARLAELGTTAKTVYIEQQKAAAESKKLSDAFNNTAELREKLARINAEAATGRAQLAAGRTPTGDPENYTINEVQKLLTDGKPVPENRLISVADYYQEKIDKANKEQGITPEKVAQSIGSLDPEGSTMKAYKEKYGAPKDGYRYKYDEQMNIAKKIIEEESQKYVKKNMERLIPLEYPIKISSDKTAQFAGWDAKQGKPIYTKPTKAPETSSSSQSAVSPQSAVPGPALAQTAAAREAALQQPAPPIQSTPSGSFLGMNSHTMKTPPGVVNAPPTTAPAIKTTEKKDPFAHLPSVIPENGVKWYRIPGTDKYNTEQPQ